MKSVLFLFGFLISAKIVFAQSQYTDSILQRIGVEKNEDKKVDLLFSIYTPDFLNKPTQIIETGKVLLKQSQERNDLIKQSSAYCFLGFGYRLSGSMIKGLEFHQKALTLAEKSGNFSMLAMTKNLMGHIYRDREDYDKALQLYLSALADGQKGKNEMVKAWPLMNIGAIYLSKDKPDSALKYLQSSYELCLKVDTLDLPYTLWNLGAVHSRIGNAALAVTYFNMAIQKAIYYQSARQLSLAYTSLAEHFERLHLPDSCIFYSKKAVSSVQNTEFFTTCIRPARLLADMYEKRDCDSTLKYASIYKIANDSLYSKTATQQIQLMTFDEDMRQQEMATEKLKIEEQRRQNIQLALIAFGIIAFIILFLLFSRSIVANERLISFFGILGLLVVFEFINLVIHPGLSSITNDSPVLMLLGLVLIASLLIPLHHRLQKWIKDKMTEKNKAIRLAAAKKTIEKLDKKQKTL